MFAKSPAGEICKEEINSKTQSFTSNSTDSTSRTSNSSKMKPNSFFSKAKKLISKETNSTNFNVILDSLSSTISKFEKFENAEFQQNFDFFQDELRKDLSEKVSNLRQKLQLELETVSRNFELTLHESEISRLEDDFRQTIILLSMGSVFGIILTSPLSFEWRCLLVLAGVIGSAFVGRSYIDLKRKLRSESFNFQQQRDVQEVFESFGEEAQEEEQELEEEVKEFRRRRSSRFSSDHHDRRFSADAIDQIQPIPENTLLEEENDGSLSHIEEYRTSSPSDFKHGTSFNILENSGISFESSLAELENWEKDRFHQFQQNFKSSFKEMTSQASCELNLSEKYDFPDDFNQLKFLQADKYDVKLAVKRMISCIIWRQQKGVTKFAENPPKEYKLYLNYRERILLGRNKEHIPVIYEDIGKFFGHKGVPKDHPLEFWMQAYSYQCSLLGVEFRKASIAAGRDIHKFVFIGDLKNTKFAMVRKLSLITAMKNDVEKFFPEAIAKIYLINAPSFVARVWKMVSKVLDPTVVSKITISSGIPFKDLVEDMGEDIVPQNFGGKNPIKAE